MREQRRGRIISMSSTSGVFGNSGQANYGAAKDGIAGLTRVVARDLGKYGITVNAVCPGASTRMTQTVSDSARARARQKSGIQGPGAQRTYQLEHTGPENVAPWVVYLATDAAAHVNGQIFFVMGGLIALLNYPAPVRTMQKDGRWTPEEIATLFPRTLGHGPGEPGAGAGPPDGEGGGDGRPAAPAGGNSLRTEAARTSCRRTAAARSLPRGWPPSGRAGCAP